MKNYLLLLLLTPFLLLAEATKEKPTVTQLFSVQTVKVKSVKTSHIKKNYGYVVADETKISEVSPRFGGYVVKLYADTIYKHVKKGEALALVYSPEVYKAKEDYLNAYNYTKNKTNKNMLKSAKRNLTLLGLNAAEIDAILKKQKVSEYTTLYSPASGYIFEKNIVKGTAFNAKSKLFEIVNLDTIWVETKVFEDDLKWLKFAQDFEVHLKTTDNVYKTNSKLFYPHLDPKEATLTMRLRLENKNNTLFPGMYASVISKDKMRKYLILPQSAVIRKNGKYYVFIVSEFQGEYEPKEIKAEALNNETYIIQGLNAGDEVVNNAMFMMDSDAQINGLF